MQYTATGGEFETIAPAAQMNIGQSTAGNARPGTHVVLFRRSTAKVLDSFFSRFFSILDATEYTCLCSHEPDLSN